MVRKIVEPPLENHHPIPSPGDFAETTHEPHHSFGMEPSNRVHRPEETLARNEPRTERSVDVEDQDEVFRFQVARDRRVMAGALSEEEAALEVDDVTTRRVVRTAEVRAKLFEELTSTTVGFDAGVLITITDELTLGIAVQDIGSKYKWDTKSLYSQDGKQTEDKFPMLRRIALAYKLPDERGAIDAEFENSSEKTNILRIGGEYTVNEHFALRAGLDRWELSDNATGVKPSFGFTAKKSFNDWTPALHYAFIIEGFAPHGMHIITLTGSF